jgi:hypothetical protein
MATTLVLGTGTTTVAAVRAGAPASEQDWELARATGMVRDAEEQGASETWLVRAEDAAEGDLDDDPAVIAYTSRPWTRANVDELERAVSEMAAARAELDAHVARAAAALAAAQAGRAAYVARDEDGVHFASED